MAGLFGKTTYISFRNESSAEKTSIKKTDRIKGECNEKEQVFVRKKLQVFQPLLFVVIFQSLYQFTKIAGYYFIKIIN